MAQALCIYDRTLLSRATPHPLQHAGNEGDEGNEGHEGYEEGHEAPCHEGCCGGGARHEGNEGNEGHEGNEEGHEGHEGYEGNEGHEEVSGCICVLSVLLVGTGHERSLVAESLGGVPRLARLYNH